MKKKENDARLISDVISEMLLPYLRDLIYAINNKDIEKGANVISEIGNIFNKVSSKIILLGDDELTDLVNETSEVLTKAYKCKSAHLIALALIYFEYRCYIQVKPKEEIERYIKNSYNVSAKELISKKSEFLKACEDVIKNNI